MYEAHGGAHAAALAGATEQIALFATVHVPMVHPVFAAKALATIDHASAARRGPRSGSGWAASLSISCLRSCCGFRSKSAGSTSSFTRSTLS